MTISVSGLGSGVDYTSILDSLREVENQRVTLLTNQKTSASNKLSAWSSFADRMSSLLTASADLKSESGFDLFSTSLTSSSSSVEAESLLSATASSSAAKGSYQVVVTNQAKVEKLASGSFSSRTTALSVSGTVLINGKAVTIETADTLEDIRRKINAVNAGTSPSNVTAGIVQESTSSFKLVLTSETEGAAGMSLQNGSSGNTLGALGFNGTGTVIKNSFTGGAQSDAFTSSSTAVETLLGIASQNLSGSVVINGGAPIAIDLTDTLDAIKDDLVAAGVSASVVSETSGTSTVYRLKIEGMSSWTDENNVLQSLGLIEGGRGDVVGVTGSVANTTDGSTAITSATKITDIYGYLNYTAGDKITISGVKHDGTTVSATDFAIDSTKTVDDLLTQVETLFGDVTASVTADGKIQVVDNATGTSQLSVTLATTLTGANPGSLDFGSFGQVGTVRQYVIQQGEDAAFTVDGISMTNSTNTVTTAIPGVTLNLLGESPGTTVTVDVDRDKQGIEDKINAMLTAFNDMISFVNGQMTYNADTKTTGGPLFGNNTLKAIKLQLQSIMMQRVGTGTVDYMAKIGVEIDSDNQYTLNTTTFEEVLDTNFDDVVNLFIDSGASADSSFQYEYSGRKTVSGTYAINITQLSGTGQDVAGTIDGYDGAGSGTLLSLVNSASHANGLGISYAGTTAPASTSFVFTRGIASLLESASYQITDPTYGEIDIQKRAAQTQIDQMTDKITSTQTQIDQKMAMLKTQFEAMDAAVTELQAMQDYLDSQFD
ncbi:MAG: flagellar filament capping protein FliD [Syntrophobacteraceae bacterium]